MSKTKNWLLIGILLVTGIVVIVLGITRGKVPSESTKKPRASNTKADPGSISEAKKLQSLPDRSSNLDSEPAVNKPIRVRSEEVLARVNGVAIMLKDLLPTSTAEAEQLFSPEMYNFLLNRAIEREVAFQAAEAEGIELTEEQNRQLKKVREAVLVRYGNDPAEAVHLNVTGSIEDRIKFEVRDATSPLLLDSMLAKAGVPSPYISEAQVQEHYLAHTAEYGTLPLDSLERQRAWQKIDLIIRTKLTPTIQAEYQKELNRLVRQLKADAAITLVAKSN